MKKIKVVSRKNTGCFHALLVFLALISLGLGGCARSRQPIEPPPVVEPAPPGEPEPVEEVEPLQEVDWSAVDGWLQDDPALAMDALLKSCRALRFRPQWQPGCERLKVMVGQPGEAIRQVLEEEFIPYQLRQADGSTVGLLTGYYVPDLRGSRTRSPEYSYPLYQRPGDLLTIDLTDVYPSLSGYRLRGRLEGTRVIPYWDRDEIESHEKPLEGDELFWVADPVELFFLHIQGSGRILFEDGSSAMVNYADQNGHPYRSIGAWMIERGIMTRDQMSMQNIRAWAEENPDRVDELLGQNPSYVFFRDLGEDVHSPPGALGVPLTPGRSLAVDPRYIPLGAPVFLATTWPGTERPLQQLMSAQDTGGAIKGRVRADFFWGMGDQAGSFAGRTKQDVRLWLLLPREEEGTEL